MGEILLRKALQCRARIDKIRAALPSDPRDVLHDERLEAFIAFNVFLLVQDAVYLAAHLVAARGLGVPASQREVFDLLAQAGVITIDTCLAMGQMSALRNRVAHSYGDLDTVRMVREAPVGLLVVQRFVEQIGPTLTQL